MARQNKRGIMSRSRSAQTLAAHHARHRIGRKQIQVKRRMWKSAIARVKRLKDHGRVSKPVVKKEQGKFPWRHGVSNPDLEDGGSEDGDAKGSDGLPIKSNEANMTEPLEIAEAVVSEDQVCEAQTNNAESDSIDARSASKKRRSLDVKKTAENVAKQIKRARNGSKRK